MIFSIDPIPCSSVRTTIVVSVSYTYLLLVQLPLENKSHGSLNRLLLVHALSSIYTVLYI